ncbi:adenosylcobinamide-GDP ribazoletransferase [Metabacillus sp. RGM 3146]|uniref:adenosylcobinamide-GDP ribazoletransferase n=1 Tax=Metabacillus sp. RGM 3146 TaxID=3401092 RepID=UPI003B9B980D
MKNLLAGVLLAFQFFTALPVKRTIGMSKKRIYYMIQSLPFAGLAIGIVSVLLLLFLKGYTPLSPAACAFILWILPILLTGGLHLDGWIDTSDAYFSYRDKDKRLEIMKDPRTGAFGVLSVIVLLSARFLFIYETTSAFNFEVLLSILIIPVLSRVLISRLLAKMVPARNEGLAYYFYQNLEGSNQKWLIAIWILFFLILSFFIHSFLYFLAGTALYYFLVKRFIYKEFGGMTGDTLGGSLEGGETVLWLILWLLHYSAMA